MNLKSLRGTLCISHLENMLNANDARNVNLKGKKKLDTLRMEWNGDLQDAGVATDILDMLRPHEKVKTLSIEGYVGAKFPTWLGDPSFSNMVDLWIERCGQCKLLPSFGQLPSLKHLIIKGMDRVRRVGLEFYGERCKQPFQRLVKLCFEDMHEWQEWSPHNKDFPCLHELSISKCPKLQGQLPHYLPSLEKLSIYACERLVVLIPSSTMLQKDGPITINIISCLSLVNIKLTSTVRTLTIKDCSALESLQFVMDEGGASSTSSLLTNEENLSCIGNNNASLLDIENCPNLTSLSTRNMLPTTLKVLRLMDCPKLESIVDKLNKDTLLEKLVIYRCEKLRCLPRGLHKLFHLKEIDICKCNSLLSLGDLLPTNLRSLQIEDCEKLEALSNNIHNLCCLEEIDIQRCNSLISLGDLLPTNLRSLKFEGCEKLEAWPNNMHNLNFLQDLSVRDCYFPEECFPTNLRNLWLSGANLCEQVFELGLHRLTSLTKLSIANGSMDSFPEEKDGRTMLMLPTSLTSLRFENFRNLSFLSWKFFQNLSALEEIFIYFCPKLASLSEKCFAPSLQRLEIYDSEIILQNREIFLSVEASFKTWRRLDHMVMINFGNSFKTWLHVMLRNNDRSCLGQMIKVFLLVLQMAATPCKFRNVTICIWEFKVFLCSQPANSLRNFLKTDKVKTGHYAKMTSKCYMNIFWSSAGSY
nr:putative disease resistance rpp13-like protein 1 [Quercus suber]